MAEEVRGGSRADLRRRAERGAQRVVTSCWLRVAALARWLWRGPRHEVYEPSGWCERLFPWRARVVLVFATWLVAHMWIPTNAAAQLGWTLEYAGAVTVSLVASFWFRIFVVDGVASLLWLMLTYVSPPVVRRNPWLYCLSHGVELVNRQLAHTEAFLIWMGVLLPLTPRLDFQLPLLLGLALFGSALLNAITVWRYPAVTLRVGELQSARRPLIYLAMLAGLLILLYRARDQWLTLLPLLIAFLIVTGLRMARHRKRKEQVYEHQTLIAAFRRHQRRMSRGLDVLLGPVFMLLSVAGVLALSLWARLSHDRLAREALDGPPPDTRTCVPELGGPRAELAMKTMFLVADSQVHELGGKRFPGQTELADVLVPAAVRPVELDLLGAAAVHQLRHAFGQVIDDAKTQPVYWAHLGDLADLSCVGELERAVELFSKFAPPRDGKPAAVLAGIAPGNHDMSFTGNFFWNPYWTSACKSKRANKEIANRELRTLYDRAELDGTRSSWPNDSWLSRVRGTGGLATVSPLGTITFQGTERSVVAVFLDTGDDTVPDWGIAGLFGTYSPDQDERVRAKIEALINAHKADKAFADPVWIVFLHHPVAELTGHSRARLLDLLSWLDWSFLDKKQRYLRAPDPHLLGVITAHTHHAETHRMCVGGRVVRELVIGSTIDSPQQGAVLEIGTDRDGLSALRLRTVQTVARPGFTCAAKPEGVSASRCQRVVAQLKAAGACKPLFDEGPTPARDCSELEQPTELGDALRSLVVSTSPVDPDQIWWAQQQRAERLLACVCRDGGCNPIQRAVSQIYPLDDRALARLVDERLASGDDAREELACLAWAASAQQQHKAQGMTFASALRCAFDDPTIPAEQESVTNLSVQPCQ